MTKIFIGGFPLNTDEMEIAKLFGLYGDISTVKIVRDKQSGECKGYAFVEMTDRLAAEAAVTALNGAAIAGKGLKVSLAEESDKGALPVNKQYPATFKPVYEKVPKSGDQAKHKRPRKPM